MFQGMARGKVGDVVFSRLNGEQISRVRNRHPRNPRTNKQLIQRAIMATVLRAYSEGREIFDHAFQGYSVGLNNQRRFLSKNMKELRSALAYEFDNRVTSNFGALVVGPGTISPVPNKYLISEGNYQQNFFGLTETSAENTNAKITTPASLEGETVAQYMSRTGLIPGDIYTIVTFNVNQTDDVVFAVENAVGGGSQQLNGSFSFVRLIVNEPENAEGLIADTLFEQLFTIDETRNISDFELTTQGVANVSMNVTSAIFVANNNYEVGSIGIIRSRRDADLRSTTQMEFATWNRGTGLSWQNLLPGWTQGTQQIGESDLILEGGDF